MGMQRKHRPDIWTSPGAVSSACRRMPAGVLCCHAGRVRDKRLATTWDEIS
jgi:hypothetical protein